ncbi:MAG TPA: porin family protein, partial [Saprospiraceae bacterium]|nr:porin family protein [Saprospiraceae bacterium]
AGPSNFEVNGLGVLDLIDPYMKPITQYAVGLQYEKQLSRQFSMVTGARYASRGFGLREDMNVNLFGLDLPVGARVDTRVNYAEVPLAFQYHFTEKGISPYIKVGATAAYALNGKIQPKIDAIISWKLPAIDINLNDNVYNRWDIAATAGAGISIPTNDIGSLQLEVNYRHSLNDMFLDKITDIRIKSQGFTAGIGYTMRF